MPLALIRSCLRARLVLVAIVLSAIATPVVAGVGQWTNIGPPGGPRILAVDPVLPSTLYGVNGSGTVFKSVDAGGQWSQMASTLPGLPAALIVDPFVPSRLYAAMEYAGVWVSGDGGSSWAASNSGLAGLGSGPVLALALDPSAVGTIYCAVYGTGIFKSTNAAASWSATGTTGMVNLKVTAVAVDPVTPTTLYAGAQAGPTGPLEAFFESSNGGSSWTATGITLMGLGGDELGVRQVLVDPLTPQTIYARLAGSTLEFDSGIAKSTDGGATFSDLAAPGLTTLWTLALDPATPGRLYAGTQQGVYTSSDGATSWVRTSSGIDADVHPQVLSLVVDPTAPATQYAALGATVGEPRLFKTTDALHWQPSGEGFPRNIDALTIALDPAEPTRVYTSLRSHGVWASGDTGANWVPRNLGLPGDDREASSVVIDPQTTTTMYAAFPGAGVFKTVDRGTTFHPANAGLPSLDMAALAVDPLTPSIVYVGGDGLFRSVDGGGAWNAASAGLGSDVQAIAIDPATTATLYAGTRTGVFKSIDSGSSWAATPIVVPSGPPVVDAGTDVVVVDPSAPLTVYAATHVTTYVAPSFSTARSLRKSLDGGVSWTTITSGLGAKPVAALVIDPQRPTTLYAATLGTGIFRSVDGGASWSPFVPDPLLNEGHALAIDPARPSWLYVATFRGLFRLEGPCAVAADCTDGNPCTTDGCNPDGSCTNAAVADGTSCDDADACTIASACTDGRCRGPAPPVCDDGAECTADACSPVTGTCVTAFRPEQLRCDDADACTASDRCVAGACDGGTPVQCEPCLGCDPSLGCIAMPAPTCAEPAPKKAPFQLVADPPPFVRRVTWNWKSAAPMSFTDFGDPLLASTDYTLCVYDWSAGVPSLAVRRQMTHATCALHPCWTRRSSAFSYRTPVPHFGVIGAKLQTNHAGIGTIKLKAEALDLLGNGLPFAVDPHVTVQLRRNDGPMCWQATYASPKQNTAERFKAK